VRVRWQSLKGIVDLWVDLFAEHDLLTAASAIAFQPFIAVVAFALLALGVLAAVHDVSVWNDTIGPAIRSRVLESVYAGMNQIAQKVFSTSSARLIAFASALAIWEVSGVVRAAMGALNRIYETDDERPWWIRFPLSFVLATAVIAALIGALLLVWVVSVSGGWRWPLLVGRWLLAVALIMVAFGVLVRWAPAERRAKRWASAGGVLVVVAWIVETLVFRWYVTSVADFETAIGSLLFFIVGASYLYVAAIILLVAMELDELVREDVERADGRRPLLPLVEGVIRGEPVRSV
jgi:membrane protein